MVFFTNEDILFSQDYTIPNLYDKLTMAGDFTLWGKLANYLCSFIMWHESILSLVCGILIILHVLYAIGSDIIT